MAGRSTVVTLTLASLGGGTSTVVSPPNEARVRVTTVERPAILGGSRESGTLVLRWDSRE